jgi:hypothetical protein
MLYLGACTGDAPPVCHTCLDCFTEVFFGSATWAELAEAAPCPDFSFTPIDYPNINYPSTVPGCLGIPFASAVDLDWQFDYTSIIGDYSIFITLDKAANADGLSFTLAHSASLTDPGGGPDYVFETVYSDWTEITGSARRFRFRVEFNGGNFHNQFGCVWEGEYQYLLYRVLNMGANIYLEWEPIV